ncbi:hypothetical protein EJB05_46730 [Eragrostis curvula]|uniref:KIB1-4 beta-propeller domain-containing protein n=1 Tax=Eragrostis curvula TaxID=38414 RepID=A0A5J9TP46_9POAL|nr:hypothetical protein EJB05_46730 [Eragrostis curvula]
MDYEAETREPAIMQSPSKITGASVSSAPDPSRLQGWADLPEGLLHSIIRLLGSFLDLLAFAGSCSSWHAAFTSYPHKSTFRTLLPPLLVRPNIRVSAPHLPSSHDGHKLRTCQVIDPANPNIALRCQIPQETLQKKHFAGFSYGKLICGHRREVLIVDVFTGVRVSPPQLPFSEDSFFYCGMLTAPLTSPNSHLLICAQPNGSSYSCKFSLFDWLVGSDSWSELRLDDARIDQIVDFNGQLIAMDYHQRLYTVSLSPNLGLQEIATVWWDGMSECPFLRPWLVVCGDMLLIVDHYVSFSFGAPVIYKAYCLNMLTNPATWAEVEKLENYTLFVGADVRSPPFSCTSPGRWGGRSNCLYYAHDIQPWSLHGLGDEADAVWDSSNDPELVFKRNWYGRLQPFWVYPSMFYTDGQ